MVIRFGAAGGTKHVPQRRRPPRGSRATMPMVMTSDTPLPMPRSVICSPSHISSIVPVVMISTV